MKKKMLVLAGVVLCASCGPSQQQIDAERANAQNLSDAQNVSIAAAEHADKVKACQDKQASDASENENQIRQDVNIVKTTLSEIDRSGSTDTQNVRFNFMVEIGNLGADEWAWSEKENAAVGNENSAVGHFDLMHYTVKPGTLSNTVEVSTYLGMPAVKFVCQAKGCIHTIGRRVNDANDTQQLLDVDEYRDQNYWAVDTQSRASGLADTMSDLLRRTSANQSRPDCQSTAS